MISLRFHSRRFSLHYFLPPPLLPSLTPQTYFQPPISSSSSSFFPLLTLPCHFSNFPSSVNSHLFLSHTFSLHFTPQSFPSFISFPSSSSYLRSLYSLLPNFLFHSAQRFLLSSFVYVPPSPYCRSFPSSTVIPPPFLYARFPFYFPPRTSLLSSSPLSFPLSMSPLLPNTLSSTHSFLLSILTFPLHSPFRLVFCPLLTSYLPFFHPSFLPHVPSHTPPSLLPPSPSSSLPLTHVLPSFFPPDFDLDDDADKIGFMIKRIKVHTTDALKDPAYRFPGNYGVEKFLELFSEEDYDAFCLAYMFTYRY